MRLLVLALILASGYERASWSVWIDADHDCQNTREEVLIRESTITPTLDETGCHVTAGRWLDPYSDTVFTDPGKLDVDHVVPLANANRSGAAAWDRERKRDYANSPEDPWHLRAVSARLNRQKGAKGPDHWMPPSRAIRCEYGRAWERIKKTWGLTATHEERVAWIVAQRACR